DLELVQRDRAAFDLNHADHAVKRGRLARAVGTEEPHDFPGGNGKRDPVDHAPRAVIFEKVLGFKNHGFVFCSDANSTTPRTLPCPAASIRFPRSCETVSSAEILSGPRRISSRSAAPRRMAGSKKQEVRSKRAKTGGLPAVFDLGPRTSDFGLIFISSVSALD